MVFWENQRIVTELYIQKMRGVCVQFGLTQMEFNIMMFLSDMPEHDTASDVIRIRMFTKSHVYSAVKTLEDKGYITKVFSGSDKAAHLKLLEKANEVIDAGHIARKDFASQLLVGFSDEEKDKCRQFLHRMCDNARIGLESEELY